MPFRGLGLLVAPLAFIFQDRPLLYAVFRAMYCRYFIHLHTLNSEPSVRREGGTCRW
jgi:hypothetical protein